MDLFSHPLVWICRFRHRKGYGVHSPFAFNFLTQVVYESTPFDIYADLDGCLELRQRFRVRKILHLLLRCTNWRQPQNIVARCAPHSLSPEYLHAGCLRASLMKEFPEGKVDFCFLEGPDDEFLLHYGEQTMLIVDNLRACRGWFRALPSVVSMDLYDIGIAFFDSHYKKQHYIVNF